MFRKLYLSAYSMVFINKIGIQLKFIEDPKEKLKLRAHFSKKLLTRFGIEVKVKNLDKLPRDKSIVLITNHRGIIDPIVIETAFHGLDIPVGYWAAKDDLYNSPFFGSFIRNSGTILVNRKLNDTSRFVKEAKDRISEGHSVYMFPEGTRNKTEETLLEFQGGATILAMKNKVDILPIYIKTNTANILGNALESSEKQVIEIEIGNLINGKERKLQDKFKEAFNLA